MSNQPLIYIDGVRVASDAYRNLAPGSLGQQYGTFATPSPLDDINPNDVERIEVIKGAAATTLYGTEAASGVIQIINALRDRAGVDRRQVSVTLEEGWTYLKRERGIELWLEGRRLSDLRRWDQDQAPGSLAPEELGTTNGGPNLSTRALCMPIPQSEQETNPNL